MTAADAANLDDLHNLIDCIQVDMTLSGLDEVSFDSSNTLASALMDFFRHHMLVTAAFAKAERERDRLREAIWPGLPKWEPTAENPQQDFYETVIEGILKRIVAIRQKLETIVCTEGTDKGVVLLSYDGPTHYDTEVKGQVYDHEHFSPLGDALIELHEMTK